jgi:DNA repair protein RadC
VINLRTYDRSPNLSELKVSYRRRRADSRQERMPFVVADKVTAADYFRKLWNPDAIDFVEEAFLLCVDTGLQPLGWVKVATGGMDAAVLDPRVIFGIALQAASAGILLAHNHPSGKLDPSDKDVEVTRRLRRAGELLGIPLHDHLIVSRTGVFSMAEAGLLAA